MVILALLRLYSRVDRLAYDLHFLLSDLFACRDGLCTYACRQMVIDARIEGDNAKAVEFESFFKSGQSTSFTLSS
jgi:hypothetical protein